MTERLAVLLGGVVVGRLSRESAGDEPEFAYDPAYVRVGEVALSARLPLRVDAYPAKNVMPYLAGLLPESKEAREAWAAEWEDVDADDAFSMLAAMGRDCPGAVQFCREDQLDDLAARATEFEPLDEAAIADRIRALAGGEPSWTMPGEHWSLGGQQEKFALTWTADQWCAAHGSAATTHIFKPGIAKLHHQALVEHATMAAAGSLGVVVASSAFERFEDQWAIVVERFDRARVDGEIVRIHQEDFAQACGRMPQDKYESRRGPTLRDMMQVVTRESTNELDDKLALADFVAINLVAGAPDGHSKNIALLRAPGYVGIAPLYDLATGTTYDSKKVDRSVAVSIGGERLVSRIRQAQWAKAAAVVGLPEDSLLQRVAALASSFPDAFEAAIATMSDDVPGAGEVGERTVPALRKHARTVLSGLPA
ncbi:HipA domain-containing protein [Nocardioides carbamazepini]|uniref:HipA domain-containing protein n=1 Tax=Nocardioides carbamazepini TaxID=2854259 RepID=UPI002149ACB9|nr:HipA domain-containing protein [Nocardioides carbamazepini]MCR1784652.1 HipA domain-containing protein [Nocardioides carbamazepini]